ncbi:trypsin-like serine protease [Amycolatopsis sp. NPDC059657]|uniref:trypsin-like serine protease n=1 Tax=Amycolatopsis sp. NPDC059657 TaxID=3346899 RepID=UPI00366D2AA4
MANISQHEGYAASTGANNIAVLVLKENIRTSANVRTGVLPLPLDQREPHAWHQSAHRGWGSTTSATHESATVEHYADMPVISRDACNAAYSSGKIRIGMFCAKAKVDKHACFGDAGGPALEGNTVVGLMTARNGCNNPGKPDIYTRVGAFELWLVSKIQ